MSGTVNFVFDRQLPNAGKKQSVKGKKILKQREREEDEEEEKLLTPRNARE